MSASKAGLAQQEAGLVAYCLYYYSCLCRSALNWVEASQMGFTATGRGKELWFYVGLVKFLTFPPPQYTESF